MNTEDDFLKSLDELNYYDGVRISHEAEEKIILDVRWKNNIHLFIREIGNYTRYKLSIERDDTGFVAQYFPKFTDKQLGFIQKYLKEINDGKYNNQKTTREKADEIISQRSLTSYMNQTKWREFRKAMLEEISVAPAFEYKSLFDSENIMETVLMKNLFELEGPHSVGDYQDEDFNFLDYKSIEWIAVRPRFYSLEGGRLTKQEVHYDVTEEFENILRKYNIPYEKKNEIYMIYGYK